MKLTIEIVNMSEFTHEKCMVMEPIVTLVYQRVCFVIFIWLWYGFSKFLHVPESLVILLHVFSLRCFALRFIYIHDVYNIYIYTTYGVLSCSTMCLYCYIRDNALGEPWWRYRLHSGFICSHIYFWRIGYVYIINYLENYLCKVFFVSYLLFDADTDGEEDPH